MRLRSLSVRSDATSFTHKSHKSHRTGIHTTKTPPDKEKNVSMLRVLSNPKVIIALSGTVIGASCQGFLEARLRQKDLGVSILALLLESIRCLGVLSPTTALEQAEIMGAMYPIDMKLNN